MAIRVKNLFMSFHFLPHPSPQFIYHVDGSSKVIRLLLPRDLEMRKDEGLLLVLVQVGVFLPEGFPKIGIFLLHHGEHGLPMVLVVENRALQVVQKISFLAVVQVDVQ